ncbi:hypothetical protein [Novosphingobium sp. 9U]|uniref:hypothetical protein n=1 Tax=Novosphingobium sp. 9U TaxID=2653158 RepID=UPI00135B6DE5|nr:hypothetical protein [Novosphingobium sp. 9U]
MRHDLLAVLTALLLSQQVAARPAMNPETRAAFREAVEDYQMFVVPHCAPEVVQSYVLARANRDRAFLQSLRRTELYADYKQAVADGAAKDARTIYECSLPPPPPPPAPPGMVPAPPSPVKTELSQQGMLIEHSAQGDRQFETMVRLRDALLGSKGK